MRKENGFAEYLKIKLQMQKI